jgi:hypothetical protein
MNAPAPTITVRRPHRPFDPTRVVPHLLAFTAINEETLKRLQHYERAFGMRQRRRGAGAGFTPDDRSLPDR